MKELSGKYGNAKVFTDLVEQTALDQISTLLDQEFIKDSQIRIMPDVHAGAGCTIGTTMTISDKCCPNLVGVDIGCGMRVVNLGKYDIDLVELDRVIRDNVPSGFNIHKTENLPWSDIMHLDELTCHNHVDIERAKRSLGTLGGGNHFIEVDQDDEGYSYLVIHSGSRHLGLEVAGYYQDLAEKQLRGIDKASVRAMIDEMKASGRHSEIASEILKLKTSVSDIPKDLAYVSGELFNDYIQDMRIVQQYASMNRLAIYSAIARNMSFPKWRELEYTFETIHNYIDIYDMILRKGAVSAKAGERLLIPINMRDGSLICRGKGNPDWNYSAPHGAGRLMSRNEAKKKFSMDEFSKSMDGIYTTSVNSDTLDECPMAYKPIESIVDNIGDTVEIEKIIRPIYNFKASE